jgi:polyisoprenoid-binding protein YceI
MLMALLVTSTTGAMQAPCVVSSKGYFRILVGTGGLFGGFAHEHLIKANKIEGCATIQRGDFAHSSIRLAFSELRVIDPKESAKDRAEVQKTMDTEVLRVSEFPQVTFESTSVQGSEDAAQMSVTGNLTIRGKAILVTIPLELTHFEDGTYRAAGKYNFKQSIFGIKPIQLAGGTIKVKDQLQTEFEIFLR